MNFDYISILKSKSNSTNDIDCICSNQEWASLYYGDGLLVNCSLVKYGLLVKAENYVLPWNAVPSLTKEEKLVSDIRRVDFNIQHGISFVSRTGGDTTSIALASSYPNIDFYSEIFNNEQKVKRVIEALSNGHFKPS